MAQGDRFTVFAGLNTDPAVQAMLRGDIPGAVRRLAAFAEEDGIRGNAWHAYLCRLLAGDDNVFSRTVELTGRCGPSLERLARMDLQTLEELEAEVPGILARYEPSVPADDAAGEGRSPCAAAWTASIRGMAAALPQDPDRLYEALVGHLRTLGRGLSARYSALAWTDGLTGVADTDRITLDELVGIDNQKRTLVENTERFLQGAGANNVLLFGDSGTGKSSCVKALVNRYQTDGLRLVEMTKHQLGELEKVLAILAASRHRYIVFLDDLSFEEGELGYKRLKAALEGKAAVTPENVLFYATSNRRHLIRESWADRAAGDEEVHMSDTMQEKLSLSDRFGLRVVFPSPSQDTYLAIVESYLLRMGIPFSDALRARAIQWELTYNGRSGRTARQFVRSLGPVR
ncbi:MAG: ATP-binding protein [Clostridia bacterium]|nr:ATP-binding protein [Clostridia bacterium]